MALNVYVVVPHNHNGNNSAEIDFRDGSVFAEKDVEHVGSKKVDAVN
ncbi:hypothetical protein [Neorhizobium sp. JUb45]|nr:hypothetical protein [Neorhizobium sp. JUb45]